MKIVYLDQNHWIEIAKARNGRASLPGVAEVFASLKRAAIRRQACFPLSLGHWMETFKQRAPDRRARLAMAMLDLSHGLAVASPHVVIRYEVHSALSRVFPDRIPLPTPVQYLGRGLAHATDGPFGVSLDWPEAASAIPEAQRHAFEAAILSLVELSILSATLPTGDRVETGPLTDLSSDRRFKAGLDAWRGIAKHRTVAELERRVYATTLADMEPDIRAVLGHHCVPIEDFAALGEDGWCRLLDDMPSRKADMHLRRQWAKNPNLTPRESDLNDWIFLETAVQYCDVVVTEKQTADLFGRGLKPRAEVVTRLADVPGLLAG